MVDILYMCEVCSVIQLTFVVLGTWRNMISVATKSFLLIVDVSLVVVFVICVTLLVLVVDWGGGK